VTAAQVEPPQAEPTNPARSLSIAPELSQGSRLTLEARRRRRQASDRLDRNLAEEQGGRLYHVGEYNPMAAPRMLAEIDAEQAELERIRVFGLALARAVDSGDSLSEVRERFKRGTASVFRCTLRAIEHVRGA